jgi:hypothetical protein
MEALTEQDQRILALAGAQFKYPAAREQQAKTELGLSGVRFWQEVNRLLDTPAAHAWDPHTVSRLKRQRIQRARPPMSRRVF